MPKVSESSARCAECLPESSLRAAAKTFFGCKMPSSRFSPLGVVKRRAVVYWFPSDAILTQTWLHCVTPQHPYRQKIDVAFGSRVEVYTKEQL